MENPLARGYTQDKEAENTRGLDSAPEAMCKHCATEASIVPHRWWRQHDTPIFSSVFSYMGLT